MNMNRYWARYIDREGLLSSVDEFMCEDHTRALIKAKTNEGFGVILEKMYLTSVHPIEIIYEAHKR
jgi:hypothetical protein